MSELAYCSPQSGSGLLAPTLATTPCRWYAVQTRANFEKTVREQLTTKGLENYLPVVKEVHHWKDRKRVVEMPLFRGYVFVNMEDSGASRLAVLHTPGAVRILGCTGAIEPVPSAEIDAVRLLLRAEVRVLGHPFLREGDWVRVKRGVLKGLEGILIRIKHQLRLVVSVNLLSQSVAMEIEADEVESVPKRRDGGDGA